MASNFRAFLKSKRLVAGLYLAPTIAAFSLALVMMPGIRPQAIDSIANSTADIVIGQPDMNSNLINQIGYAKTLNRPGVVVCYDGKLFVADIYNNRVLIYNSIPASDNATADVVIGQPDMISNSANQGGSVAANTLYSPYGLEVKNGKLIIADAENNRVLIYNTIPTSNNASADVVIGQRDMTSSSTNQGLGSAECAANTLYYPVSVFCDGTRLYVADYNNNRVLLFNSIPASNNASADVVIGQPDMTSNVLNNGGISARTLNQPRDVYAYTDTGGTYRLIIPDQKNHRVLIYNSVPVSNQPSPEAVIGQNAMDTRTSGCTSIKLDTPSFVRVINDKLFLGDYVNQRILIYNSLPTGVGAAADKVLGQPNMISKTINNGGLSSKSFNYMFDFDSDGTKFLATDGFNNRILIFNTIPATDFAPSDNVIGQPDMTSNSVNQTSTPVNASTAYRPGSPCVAGGKFFRTDFYNHRVLVYNSVPTENNSSGDIVVGQPDMTSHTMNKDGLSAKSLAYPEFVFSDGNKMFICDNWNNRILIYNSIPTSNYQAADIVIGQPSMTTNEANNGGVSARSLNYPNYICVADEKLFVSDRNNHRILIFNSIPTSNYAAADIVIGQPDMLSNTANNGGVSAKSLWYTSSVSSDGIRVFVSDHYNSRGLIYNSIPTSNYAAADIVIGQPDMTSGTYNNGGISSKSIYAPHDVYPHEGRLFVSDTYNNRVLVFNTIPTSNFASANVVIGQPDFISNTANNGGVSSTSMGAPNDVFCDGTRLFVGDPSNHRILIYNLTTTKPIISDVKFDGSGHVSGDTIRTTPVISAKMTDTGGVGGIYINNLKITADATLYTYASFDASTDSYNSTTGIFNFKVKSALATGTHNVKIEVSDYLGNWATYEANNLNVNDSSGTVQMDGIPLNYPNPFRPLSETTKITYKLTVDSDIIVYVFDVRGVLIKKTAYSSGSMGGKAGYNEITWDGKDDFGSTVGNGIYPYRIVSGGRVLGRGKIAVLD